MIFSYDLVKIFTISLSSNLVTFEERNYFIVVRKTSFQKHWVFWIYFSFFWD